MKARIDEAANCASTDPELFFPEPGQNVTTAAKTVCAACDVRGLCLDYALATGEGSGIWGGKSPKQRRKILAASAASRKAA